MNISTKSLTRGALIAAMYVLVTYLFRPISFEMVQFRISEALTLLPILMADAVPALAVGCLIANLLGGAVWYDIVLGSLATLIAAMFTRKLREKPLIAALMPALLNGLIVGPVVYFAYTLVPGDPIRWGLLVATMGTVAFGEIVVCYVLGLALIAALRKVPKLPDN